MRDAAFNRGERPGGYCRLVWDDDLGYWVYRKDGQARRATDLLIPNHARINNDMVKQRATGYEPYPLEFLAKIFGSTSRALEVIDKFGEFYRKVK